MNATLPSGRRVHIAPLGYERDRVVEPARREAADVVYLLVDSAERGPEDSGDVVEPSSTAHRTRSDDVVEPSSTAREATSGGTSLDAEWSPEAEAVDWDAATPYQLAVREELDEFADARAVPVRIHDVYDVMGVATTIAARHDEDQVFVNISSGPNVAAVGAAIACMTTDALPYSVTPESYGHDVAETPLTRGVAEVTTVPDYPIESPTREQVHILGYLYETTVEKPYSVNKRNLIDRADDYDLPFLANYSTESRQSEYRRLDAAIIEPLREKEYIRLEPAGKQKNVVLTETGISVYRAFQHKILDE